MASLAVLPLALMVSTPVQAACAETAWAGRIGTVPVSLVFGRHDDSDARTPVARYHYNLSLEDLYLRADEGAPTRWTETDVSGRRTGTLQMDCQGDRLTGTWRSTDGRRALPLLAKKLAGTDQYDGGRTLQLKPDRETSKYFEDRIYDEVAYSGVSSVSAVSLWGDGVGIGRINELLWHEAKLAMSEALDCDGEGRMVRGPKHDHEYSWRQAVAAWNERYAVITTASGGYCGGAHPYYADRAAVFDLRSADEIDPNAWLMAVYRRGVDLKSPLGRILVGRYLSQEDGETECLDRIDAGGSVYPVRTGMVFKLSAIAYVHTPCTRDVTVPWEQLTPFLSPDGMTASKAFR